MSNVDETDGDPIELPEEQKGKAARVCTIATERTAWINTHPDEARAIFYRTVTDWPAERVEYAKRNIERCWPFLAEVDKVRGVDPSKPMITPRAEQDIRERAGLPTRQYMAYCQGSPLTDAQQTADAKLWPMIQAGAIVAVIGPCGHGKTRLGVEWAIRRMLKTGGSGLYLRLMRLYHLVQSRFRPDGPGSVLQLMDRLASLDILVLDNVEARGGSDWEGFLLADLLDQRHAELRPTVLLSNEKLEVLAKNLGASVISRIQEGGGIAELVAESLRKAKAGASADPKYARTGAQARKGG